MVRYFLPRPTYCYYCFTADIIKVYCSVDIRYVMSSVGIDGIDVCCIIDIEFLVVWMNSFEIL